MVRAERGLPPSRGPRENWALFSYESYESMLGFGFTNGTCIWVALGRAALASLLMSQIPLSEDQSLEVFSMENCKIHSE